MTNTPIATTQLTANPFLLEIGGCAAAGLYEFQKARLASMNRVRALVFHKATGLSWHDLQKKKRKDEKEKSWLKEFKDTNLPNIIASLKAKGSINESEEAYLSKAYSIAHAARDQEKTYEKEIERVLEQLPLYTEYLQHIKGVGVKTAAMLIYYFGHCERAKHASSLCAFAGLTPDSKYIKGQPITFNKNLRSFLLGRVADVFVKQRSDRYRPIYDQEKARQKARMEQVKDGSLVLGKDEWGHDITAPNRPITAERRARRKMIKDFLQDYWLICCRLTGRPEEDPWILARGGHTKQPRETVFQYIERRKIEKLKKEAGA